MSKRKKSDATRPPGIQAIFDELQQRAFKSDDDLNAFRWKRDLAKARSLA